MEEDANGLKSAPAALRANANQVGGWAEGKLVYVKGQHRVPNARITSVLSKSLLQS